MNFRFEQTAEWLSLDPERSEATGQSAALRPGGLWANTETQNLQAEAAAGPSAVGTGMFPGQGSGMEPMPQQGPEPLASPGP